MSVTIRNEAEAKYPFKTANGYDFKAWAKRFVYRYEKGDKTLLQVQIVFAHEALEKPLPQVSN